MVKETLNPKGLGTSVWELFRSCISFQVCFSQAVTLMMRRSWLLLVTSQFSFNRKKSEPIAGWPWFVSTHRLQRGVQVCFGINWLPLLTHQFPVKNGQSRLNCWKHSELPVHLFFPLKAGNEAPSARTALQTLWQPVPALTPLCSSASSNSWAKMSPVPDVLYQSCQAIPFSAPRNSWKCCSFPGKAETRNGDPLLNAAGSPDSKNAVCCWQVVPVKTSVSWGEKGKDPAPLWFPGCNEDSMRREAEVSKSSTSLLPPSPKVEFTPCEAGDSLRAWVGRVTAAAPAA